MGREIIIISLKFIYVRVRMSKYIYICIHVIKNIGSNTYNQIQIHGDRDDHYHCLIRIHTCTYDQIDHIRIHMIRYIYIREHMIKYIRSNTLYLTHGEEMMVISLPCTSDKTHTDVWPHTRHTYTLPAKESRTGRGERNDNGRKLAETRLRYQPHTSKYGGSASG